MGTTGGGVWKTEDGGTYWENISDGYFQRASVGAIAIAEEDTTAWLQDRLDGVPAPTTECP